MLGRMITGLRVCVLASLTCVGCDRAVAETPVVTGSTVEVPIVEERAPVPSRVVYLNREGVTLRAGLDDAPSNRSMIVASAGLETFDVPPYGGTPRQFREIVDCVRRLFTAYDVEIVDRRPVEPGYLMVAIGGQPRELAATQESTEGIGGLAPFNGQPVENAVVIVFSQAQRERPRAVCESAAQEVGHAYGLDHTIHCRDLMSYRRPCGARRFEREDAPCGERQARACVDGRSAQSSHARLLEVLGPARL